MTPSLSRQKTTFFQGGQPWPAYHLTPGCTGISVNIHQRHQKNQRWEVILFKVGQMMLGKVPMELGVIYIPFKSIGIQRSGWFPQVFFFRSKHLNLRLADGGSYHVAHLQTHLQRRVPWIKKLFTPRRVTKSRHCSWFSEKGFERPLDFAFSMFVEKLLEPQLNET